MTFRYQQHKAAIAKCGPKWIIDRRRHRDSINPVSDAYISNGALPASNMAAGLPPKAEITSTYVESAEVSDGVITLALQGTSIAALDAASIIFEPSTSNQTLTWTCKASGSQINQYVPADCRVPL